MPKKKIIEKIPVFEKRDKFLMPAALLALVFSAFIIGNFLLTLAVMGGCVILVSSVYQAIKTRGYGKEVSRKIKETSYSLLFSVFIVLILAAGLPYLIFHREFVSLYTVQYMYLAPVMLAFFFSLPLIAEIISGQRLRVWHSLGVSLVITALISVLISFSLACVINQMYYEKTEVYWRGAVGSVIRLSGAESAVSNPELPVFQDIYSYKNNRITAICGGEISPCARDMKSGPCIRDGCIKDIMDMSYRSVEQTVDSLMIERFSKAAEAEAAFLDSPHLTNFSKETYLAELETRIDSSNFSIQYMDDKKRTLLSKLDSDIDFYGYMSSLNDSGQGGGLIIGSGLSSPDIMEYLYSGPVLENSISYAMMHTTLSREEVSLVIKTLLYTGQQAKNPDLLARLYESRTDSEPIDSRIIRDKIILNWIEGTEEQITELQQKHFYSILDQLILWTGLTRQLER